MNVSELLIKNHELEQKLEETQKRVKLAENMIILGDLLINGTPSLWENNVKRFTWNERLAEWKEQQCL